MAGNKFTTADLLSMFFMGGNAAIEAEHNDRGGIPRTTFLKACEMLRQHGDEKKHAQLERLMDRLAPRGTGAGRGRKQPEVGDVVTYSAQQVLKDGSPVGAPFARIPVNVLGALKEDLIEVVFRGDEIVLRLAQPTEEASETEDNAEA